MPKSFLFLIIFFGLCITIYAKKEITAYPQKEELWVGNSKGVISPKDAEELMMRQDADLRFEVSHGENVKKGQILYSIKDESLSLKKRSLDNMVASTDIRIQELEWESQKNNDTIKKDIERLLLEEANLDSVLSSDGFQVPAVIKQGAIKRKNKITAEVELLKKRSSEKYRIRQLEIKKRELELKLEKEELSYDQLKKSLVVKAKKAGIVKFINEDIKRGDESFYYSLEKIGHVYNNTEYIFSIDSSERFLEGRDPQNLFLKIFTGSQRGIVNANYAGITNNGNFPQVNYLLESIEQKHILSGKRYSCQVYLKLKEKCYIIPKVELSSYLSEELINSGWEAIIRKLYPETHVVAIGAREIAITKNESPH